MYFLIKCDDNGFLIIKTEYMARVNQKIPLELETVSLRAFLLGLLLRAFVFLFLLLSKEHVFKQENATVLNSFDLLLIEALDVFRTGTNYLLHGKTGFLRV